MLAPAHVPNYNITVNIRARAKLSDRRKYSRPHQLTIGAHLLVPPANHHIGPRSFLVREMLLEFNFLNLIVDKRPCNLAMILRETLFDFDSNDYESEEHAFIVSVRWAPQPITNVPQIFCVQTRS